jgi:hypothetical protein
MIGVSVLAIWVCMVAWHVRREYYVPDAARLAAGARMLAPGTHWFVIRMGDVPIGLAQSRLDTLPGGYVFNDEMTMDVPALGQVHRATARTQIDLGPSLELRGFDFVLDSRIGAFHVSARAEGDSALAVTMDAGSGPQQSRMTVGAGLLLDAALSLRMAASGALREGNEFTARIFDPSSMSERDVVVSVGPRETMVVTDSARLENGRWVANLLDTVPVFRVDQRFGGVSISNWIDEDGQIVRAESPLGFTIERMYYELARQEWQGDRSAELALGYGALIEGTAISANVDVTRIAQQPRLRVRLGGVDLEGFDLEGGRQRLRGDTLVVTKETLAETWYELPYRGSRDLGDALEATPLIQANDPRIVEVARRIAGGSTDPLVVAQRLNEWVYGELKKDVTLSVPSALQVLEARSGDCNEHTVLYVALARALGLPTRTAVGLVHIRDSFYYHAWPEVWLGEWVAVDPTLGQYPADASHLRFLIGGLARQVELIRLIGRLQLEVI